MTREWPGIARIALSGLLLLGFAAAAAATVDEIGVSQASAAAVEASSSLADRPPMPAGGCRADAGAPSPRRAVLTALKLALETDGSRAPERGCLVDHALAALDAADRGRPGWYQTAVVRSFLAARQPGVPNDAVLAMIARSYRAARFLRDDGSWRIRYVVAHWNEASPALRAATTDEAAWLSALSVPMSVHVELIMVGTPAYSAYLQRRSDMLARVSAS